MNKISLALIMVVACVNISFSQSISDESDVYGSGCFLTGERYLYDLDRWAIRSDPVESYYIRPFHPYFIINFLPENNDQWTGDGRYFFTYGVNKEKNSSYLISIGPSEYMSFNQDKLQINEIRLPFMPGDLWYLVLSPDAKSIFTGKYIIHSEKPLFLSTDVDISFTKIGDYRGKYLGWGYIKEYPFNFDAILWDAESSSLLTVRYTDSASVYRIYHVASKEWYDLPTTDKFSNYILHQYAFDSEHVMLYLKPRLRMYFKEYITREVPVESMTSKFDIILSLSNSETPGWTVVRRSEKSEAEWTSLLDREIGRMRDRGSIPGVFGFERSKEKITIKKDWGNSETIEVEKKYLTYQEVLNIWDFIKW